MTFLIVFVVTSLVFLAGDAVMLTFVMEPLFRQHLGAALLDDFLPGPAIAFYLVYISGVMWFAAFPALKAGKPSDALLNGAMLGLVAYGTYEFTSWAIMRNWHLSLAVADMTWGAVISGVSAYTGVRAALALRR